ncbi:hypothetical protein MIR68_006409 [Amoeboaphelidium protococcarum]|nr:hypothetical protein MIR68_006409 [Amoeboaphelidium protococcarum]
MLVFIAIIAWKSGVDATETLLPERESIIYKDGWRQEINYKQPVDQLTSSLINSENIRALKAAITQNDIALFQEAWVPGDPQLVMKLTPSLLKACKQGQREIIAIVVQKFQGAQQSSANQFAQFRRQCFDQAVESAQPEVITQLMLVEDLHSQDLTSLLAHLKLQVVQASLSEDLDKIRLFYQAAYPIDSLLSQVLPILAVLEDLPILRSLFENYPPTERFLNILWQLVDPEHVELLPLLLEQPMVEQNIKTFKRVMAAYMGGPQVEARSAVAIFRAALQQELLSKGEILMYFRQAVQKQSVSLIVVIGKSPHITAEECKQEKGHFMLVKRPKIWNALSWLIHQKLKSQ